MTLPIEAAAPRVSRWTWLAYGYGAIVVAALGYFLYDLPVQVSDSYGNLVQASGGTLGSLVLQQFHAKAFLRPLLWAHIRVVYDLSGGRCFEWFRGWHVAQVALLTFLFLRLVQPRRVADLAAVPVGLAALVGLHTFAGTIREAFPINAYMTILLCCLLAADLALGQPRWWRDVAAVVLFAFAVLSVESGLLVAVVVVAAYAAGARGVSRRGLVTMLIVVAGYFLLRFVVLGVGTPELSERSSGFGFSTREPGELAAMFGGSAIPFYAYNVVSSVLSVLLSEPRGGIWVATRDVVRGELPTMTVVNIAASTLGLIVIVTSAWRRRGEWKARRFDRGDQLLIVFAALLLANAGISYAYTKDVILSPAGIFFACALTVSVARTIDASAYVTASRKAAIAALLVVLSSTWALRAVAAHVGLRKSAVVERSEWATVDAWLEREHLVPTTAKALEIERQLRDDAIRTHPARPAISGNWVEGLSDD